MTGTRLGATRGDELKLRFILGIQSVLNGGAILGCAVLFFTIGSMALMFTDNLLAVALVVTFCFLIVAFAFCFASRLRQKGREYTLRIRAVSNARNVEVRTVQKGDLNAAAAFDAVPGRPYVMELGPDGNYNDGRQDTSDIQAMATWSGVWGM